MWEAKKQSVYGKHAGRRPWDLLTLNIINPEKLTPHSRQILPTPFSALSVRVGAINAVMSLLELSHSALAEVLTFIESTSSTHKKWLQLEFLCAPPDVSTIKGKPALDPLLLVLVQTLYHRHTGINIFALVPPSAVASGCADAPAQVLPLLCIHPICTIDLLTQDNNTRYEITSKLYGTQSLPLIAPV
jgi:hypothetical protein